MNLVPIFVCCVLPVSIVLIVFGTQMFADNKRAAVLIKAIEANKDINADKLAEALSKPKKTPRELLNRRLLRGCIFSHVGLGLLIVSVVGLVTGAHFEADQVSVPMLFGAVSFAVGISYLVVYFVTRKDIRD